jgi:hypothetical protein
MITKPTLFLSLACSFAAATAFAQDAAAPAGPSADELAKKLSNPVAALISVPIQQNFDFGYRNDGWRSTTNIQPVVPISISEDWNLISRTIIPVIVQEDITGVGNSESGLGDILASAFFSPKQPTASGLIWGVGPALSLPTGGTRLSVDRWLLGPSAVFLKQSGPWTKGLLINHVWDIGGPGNADVSATFLQPFLSWGGLGKGQTLGTNLEATYDWNSEQWTIPLNFSYTKISKLGGQLVSYTAGGKIYLDRPNGGPDWGLRFAITFLFPK